MTDGHDFDPDAVAEMARRAKVELRKRARSVRGALPEPAAAERSSRIVNRLLTLDAVQRARSIALFDPMLARREVDVRPVDVWARGRGVRVLYPSMSVVDAGAGEGQTRHRAMCFREGDPATMQDGGLGFREPSGEAPAVTEIDVIVVPALLVDGRGHRLGYGGGFYDRALLTHRPPAVAVAVVYHFQLAAELPTTGGDARVDVTVTDAAVLTHHMQS